MTSRILVLLLGGLVAAGLARADDVAFIGPSPGHDWDGQYVTPCAGDIKFSQPPFWDGGTASQDEEVQGQDPGCVGAVVAEAADDFPSGGPPITGIRFWGISYGLELDCPPFEVEIRPNAGGCPDEEIVLCRYKPEDKQCEIVDGFPGTFSYEHCLTLPEPCDQSGNQDPLWLTIQAHYCRLDGPFEGNQWFWPLTSRDIWGGNGNEMCFRSPFFGFPNWVPGTVVFGAPYDCAFELLTGGGVPVERSSWGALKSLYR